MLQILSLVQRKTGMPAQDKSGERISYIPYDQAYAVGFEDMRQRVPDISMIKEYTGWTPRRNLDDVLLDVLDEQLRQRDKSNGEI